jgi:hypothetical protein
MGDASAGFVVMLAGAAMTLMGVFLWQGASVALSSWQPTWVTLAAVGLLVAFPGMIVFVLSVGESGHDGPDGPPAGPPRVDAGLRRALPGARGGTRSTEGFFADRRRSQR